jgi:hypothetical protein
MNEYSLEHKGYYIKPHKEHPYCYIVVTVGKGGTVPDRLSGMYTTRALAKIEIDNYLETKPIKEEDNGKTINKGGSK